MKNNDLLLLNRNLLLHNNMIRQSALTVFRKATTTSMLAILVSALFIIFPYNR